MVFIGIGTLAFFNVRKGGRLALPGILIAIAFVLLMAWYLLRVAQGWICLFRTEPVG